MKIVSKNEVIQRIQDEYPNQPFQIILYTGITKPFIIKCLKCQQEKEYSNVRNFLQKGYNSNKKRKYLCNCYNINNKITIHKQNQQKILELCNNDNKIQFMSFDYREKVKKYSVNVLCNKCNQIFNKDYETFLNNQTCPYCFSKHNINTLGFNAILPKEYSLIGEYQNTDTRVLIKHECGFIWAIKPHNFIEKINNGYYGCPQCNHKRSKGELKIANYLKLKNIHFIEEQTFEWSSNSRFRYDFYLPEYNLIIEYMGKQYYEEVNFFHDTLEQRQIYDQLKETEAKKQNINYLIISYTNFNNIETILSDWFNDYSERKQVIND